MPAWAGIKIDPFTNPQKHFEKSYLILSDKLEHLTEPEWQLCTKGWQAVDEEQHNTVEEKA